MNKAQILFVGDFDKSFLKQVGNENWEIKHEINSERAIALLEAQRIDLIVARDKVEKLNGYQLCLFIKSNPQIAELPFIVLGNKKLKDRHVDGGLFAQPDRLAELTEVLKKPQSLVKLLTEELKQYEKKRNGCFKQVHLLPVSKSTDAEVDLVAQINMELLLERSISSRMLRLFHRPKVKNQFITEFFTILTDILNADISGIGILGVHTPWLAFSSKKDINTGSFNSLLKNIKDNLLVAQELGMIKSAQLSEKGGLVISDSILLPVIDEGLVSGVLVFAKCNGEKFTSLERAVIFYIEQYARPVFEFILTQEEIDRLRTKEAVRAAIDPLTGLYNLEFLVGFLQQQLLLSFRNKLAVSLLMVDIDSFSQLNEVLGQSIVDTVLVKISERLLSVIRGSDLLARYGSDKFVIVLPNTPLKGARVLAEKIRLEIEQTNFFHSPQPGPSITVSIGLAEYDPHDLNPEAILKEAKTALQKAKESGRNKVAM